MTALLFFYIIVFLVFIGLGIRAIYFRKKRVKAIDHARAKKYAEINVNLAQDFLEDLLQKFHVANLDN